uniref:Uncharacterized protein n=1 Tax=Ditylenchus dipsaci TaxID=166011 RepID=A0A915CVH7_9BILA
MIAAVQEIVDAVNQYKESLVNSLFLTGNSLDAYSSMTCVEAQNHFFQQIPLKVLNSQAFNTHYDFATINYDAMQRRAYAMYKWNRAIESSANSKIRQQTSKGIPSSSTSQPATTNAKVSGWLAFQRLVQECLQLIRKGAIMQGQQASDPWGGFFVARPVTFTSGGRPQTDSMNVSDDSSKKSTIDPVHIICLRPISPVPDLVLSMPVREDSRNEELLVVETTSLRSTPTPGSSSPAALPQSTSV